MRTVLPGRASLLALALLMAAPAMSRPSDAPTRDKPLPLKPAKRTAADLTLLYFRADFCAFCKRFERAKGVDSVQRSVKGLTMKPVDVLADTKQVSKYEVKATPAFVLVDGTGQVLARPQISVDDPRATVDRVVKAVAVALAPSK